MSFNDAVREYFYLMGREGMPLSNARDILRHAGTYQRNQVAQCNIGQTDELLRKEASAEKRIRKALPEGWGVHLQGDPRGACVKLKAPSGYTNDWGNEGICIPAKG